MTLPQLLRLGLFLGGSLLAATVFLLAHWAIERLSREVATTSRLLAQFCAEASYPAIRNPMVEEVFRRLVSNIDFPIIVTDRNGLPRAWRGLDLADSMVTAESLDSLAAGQSVAPLIAQRVESLRSTAARFDRRNAPIPLTQSRPNPLFPQPSPPLPLVVKPDTLGAVHYGEPHVLEVLRWTPYVSLGGTVLLIGLGLWGLAVIRQAEKRTIWVGMAKETAHQLGTPLSSLMGWSEMLRTHVPDPPAGEVRIAAAELSETLNEIGRDVDRLRRVASRFSNVGSEPNLQTGDPTPAVREVASYMRRRFPKAAPEVVLRERYQPVPAARFNAELLEWAVENLIANALSALDKQPAWIDLGVEASADRRWVEITVADNGHGMTAGEQRRAFEPGYTTKRRGWGLGLPLARRVVQDSHGGRIWIRSSAPGQGTTVVIRLPAVPGAAEASA